ncbi:hypothetical protein IE3_05673 [Bacillus cereus BAG3X2-1]|jgi:hypothetical protein|uniref:Uncharacterized protein n=1 Tax=Bacillus cereus TaxID=1396 RepID=A0A2A9VQQ5_BACCE|nr:MULTISPECIES: hypothetical protein [Bacillus cereus group]EJQ02814.1 hypothetical protein IE3_05673 [Bacillus cereus BAG3X2-1]PEA22799.1 hypothetical protein CON40_01745 [Bacillus cereus]PFE58549.1 hypothetical protein CN318_00100 [Bacillus cereus]PFI35034.1 hypothetical protein COI72_23365 [Bacillus cereus]PFI97803.1 hypothetical protein COI88_26610 [Bacillus cereus]
MDIQRKKTGTTRKLVRYMGGMAVLLFLVSFIYQWNKGLEIDTTENFGLVLVIAIFLSSFIPEKRGASK